MPNYDFTPLSSYDFEILVRDLLQSELSVTIESFKAGRDSGIDLRYTASGGQYVIVQCKHFVNSGYNALLSHLKKEVSKVSALKPAKYIVATSVGLTPANKNDIQTLFSPYCSSTGDIYGKEDLNNLLGKFPEIEKRNFKLWLTSQAVLDRVVNASIINRSALDLERVIQKVKYYVQNTSFFEATSVLEEYRYCIIAGMPGIGKTTLAEMLMIHYINIDFEVVVVSNDIEEAFAVYNPEKKQFFYYDDFLGQTTLEYKLNKNEDRRLLQFIDAAKRNPNTRFVMTTREYILNRAKLIYERLASSNFDIKKCTIDLSKYTHFDRAKILFNHLYFSIIPQGYKNELLHQKRYKTIINHKNYSPRIIEWMTDYFRLDNMNSIEYYSYFIRSLDDPTRLWEHAFENQLTASSRYLLLVLSSMPDETLIDDLEVAYSKYYTREAELHNFTTSPFDFKRSLKELEGNFIFIEKTSSHLVVRFHNPSIQDFLSNYLSQNPSLLSVLVENLVFFEQCIKLWGGRDDEIIIRRIEKRLQTNESDIRTALRQIADVYWRALEDTFQGKDCLIYRARESREVFRHHRSQEARLTFILDVSRKMPNQSFHNIISKLLISITNTLESDIKQRTGNYDYMSINTRGDDLLELLKKLKEHGAHNAETASKLVSLAKQFYIAELGFLDGYVNFVGFQEVFPALQELPWVAA